MRSVTKSAVECCVDAPPTLQQRAKRLSNELSRGGSAYCRRASKATGLHVSAHVLTTQTAAWPNHPPAHARRCAPCEKTRVLMAPWEEFCVLVLDSDLKNYSCRNTFDACLMGINAHVSASIPSAFWSQHKNVILPV